jgi:heme/copper-type cytochrome/quinol oxidase subunit 2
MRLFTALFASLAARAVLAAGALVFCISSADCHPLTTEVWLWLPVRWLVGLIAPLIFGMMAYSAAKIRSTQSATGILYVAAVCTILGELVGVLLARQTGLPL